MSTAAVTHGASNGAVLTEAQIDTLKQGIETYLNTTKLDTANFQEGTITNASIEDGAVTAAKLASDSVITGKIEAGAITTAKLSNGIVSHAKCVVRTVASTASEGNMAQSGSSTTTTATTTTFVAVTGVNATVTLGGGTVLLLIQSASGTGTSATLQYGRARILRNGSVIKEFGAANLGTSGYLFYDSGATGVTSYTLQVAKQSGAAFDGLAVGLTLSAVEI